MFMLNPTCCFIKFDIHISSRIQSFSYNFYHQWLIEIHKYIWHDDIIEIVFFNNEAETVVFNKSKPMFKTKIEFKTKSLQKY